MDTIDRLESLVRSAINAAPPTVADEYAAEIQAGFARLREQRVGQRAPNDRVSPEYSLFLHTERVVYFDRRAAEADAAGTRRVLYARWVTPWTRIERFDEQERHPTGGPRCLT